MPALLICNFTSAVGSIHVVEINRMPEGLHLALWALWLSSAFGALVTPLPYPVSLVIWIMHYAGSHVADGLFDVARLPMRALRKTSVQHLIRLV